MQKTDSQERQTEQRRNGTAANVKNNGVEIWIERKRDIKMRA